MLNYQIIPNIYFLCSGSSEGQTSLTSFDGALLNAGVGNTNLIKVSSILPPACQEVDPFAIPEGSLLPIAYASLTSSHPGEIISSAIAIAIPEDRSVPGVIMEHSATASATTTEAQVQTMAKEAMQMRDIDKFIIKSKAIEATVTKITTTFAGTVLWSN